MSVYLCDFVSECLYAYVPDCKQCVFMPFLGALLQASLDMLLVMHEKLMTARQQSSGLDRCRQPTKKSTVRDNFLP